MLHGRFVDNAQDHVLTLGTQLLGSKTFPRTVDARTRVSLVSELDETTKACMEALERGVEVLKEYVQHKRLEIADKHEVLRLHDGRRLKAHRL